MHLVINSYGSTLSVKEGLFQISHPEGVRTIAPDKVKSITIRKGIKLSSNAIYLAIEHQIDFIIIDRSGKPFGRIWSNRFGSIATIRRTQVDWAKSIQGAKWTKLVIITKIENQAAILQAIAPDLLNKTAHQQTLLKLAQAVQKIKQLPEEPILAQAAQLRGIEGSASKQYWSLVSSSLPEKYRFTERSQHPALDPFNCLLNYAYGILYAIVEGEIIKAGIDPYLGVLHRDEYNRPTMVYDLIELFRIWADYIVIDLCQQSAIGLDSFSVENGAYWLEGYGKRILVQCLNDYLDDVITFKTLTRSRRNHINFECKRLMKEIMAFREADSAKAERNTPSDQDDIPF